MKTAIALPLLVLALLASPAAAENAAKPWLNGITAVNLKISMSQALVDGGAQGARLRTQLELKLRSAGIQVDPSLSQPILYVEATGFQVSGTNAFSYFVSLQLSDNVKLDRNGEALFTTIWGPSIMVLYSPRDLDQTIAARAMEKVDEFLNDWLRANPRGAQPATVSVQPEPSAPSALASFAAALFGE